jgi:hypothetical protein
LIATDRGSSYTTNRQYGKALPFFLRLRRPNVFELIREHNLSTDVKDQVLLLVEFDQELLEKRKREGTGVEGSSGEAIALLVDHIHSIPVRFSSHVPFTMPQHLYNRLLEWFSSSLNVASIYSFT